MRSSRKYNVVGKSLMCVSAFLVLVGCNPTDSENVSTGGGSSNGQVEEVFEQMVQIRHDQLFSDSNPFIVADVYSSFPIGKTIDDLLQFKIRPSDCDTCEWEVGFDITGEYYVDRQWAYDDYWNVLIIGYTDPTSDDKVWHKYDWVMKFLGDEVIEGSVDGLDIYEQPLGHQTFVYDEDYDPASTDIVDGYQTLKRPIMISADFSIDGSSLTVSFDLDGSDPSYLNFVVEGYEEDFGFYWPSYIVADGTLERGDFSTTGTNTITMYKDDDYYLYSYYVPGEDYAVYITAHSAVHRMAGPEHQAWVTGHQARSPYVEHLNP